MNDLKTVLVAVCALLPSFALGGQQASDQLRQAAGKDKVPAVRPIGKFVELQPPTLPNPATYKPHDVFEGCSKIDAKFQLQPALDDAVGTVNECFMKYYRLRTSMRTWTIDASAAQLQVLLNGKRDRTQGIKIELTGKLLVGSPVVLDLQYSLKKRQGYLMTYPAELVNKTKLPGGR